jgi:hypothetical protein
LKTPAAAASDGSADEIEGMVLEKALLIVPVHRRLSTPCFCNFWNQRISDDWKDNGLQPDAQVDIQ